MDRNCVAHMLPWAEQTSKIQLRASCEKRRPQNILTVSVSVSVCILYHCPAQFLLVDTNSHSAIQSLSS